jgi:serine/threonine protein phosphatase PrpC
MVIGNGLRDLFSLSSKDKDKQVKPTSEWVMSLSQDQLKQSLHSAFADLHESIDSSKFTDGTAAMVALVYYPRDRFAAWVAEQSSASSQGKTSPRMSSTTDAVVSPRAPKKRNTVTHSKEDSDAIMSQVSSYSTGHLRSNSFVEHNRNTVDGGSMLRNVNSNSIPKPKARLIIANTGDQRLVLCRNGKAIQVTVDHKPDAPEELDRIRRGGGFVAENRRVNGVLALSRALGDVDLQPHVTYVPDIFFMDLQEDDEFLIMACDGLWDVVSSEQAVQLVQSEHADPIRSATKLRDYAHCLNSTDNISVVVFQLRDPTSTTVRGARARSFGEPNLLNDPKKEK